ncbi:MAG: hypothetical protein ACYC5O_09530 [Anaerolineae bacterium]
MPGFALDTTVLSNFASVRRLQLLPLALGEGALSAPAVMQELAEGHRLGYLPECDWSWLSVPDLTAEETAAAARHLRRLGRGETECLALAAARRAVFVSDDRAARSAAREAGLAVSGTVGILLLLARRSHLTAAEAEALQASMAGGGYRSPVRSLAELADLLRGGG